MSTKRDERPPVAFISWGNVPERSTEIAEALGGEARSYYMRRFTGPLLTPVRYASGAVRTVMYLLVKRPRAVVVTNPSVFPGLISYLYGRIAGAPVVLDSHPTAFGLSYSPRSVNMFLALHWFLIPRVSGSIVTVDDLVDEVRQRGGEAAIVHEAPPRWSAPPPPPLQGRPSILLVSNFNGDEPVSLVVEAAHRLPGVDIAVTGDLERCPPELLSQPAPNLRFVGFLSQLAYLAALKDADVVISLTDRAEAVNRVANEAVFARRPLITSDSPALHKYFPYAVHVTHTVDGVVAGVEEALRDHDRLRSETEPALRLQEERWAGQLEALRQFTGVS